MRHQKRRAADAEGNAISEAHLSFAGHETFVFRYAWLTKAVEAVQTDPEIFSRDNAIVRLGVGKNMVRSIRHWGLATGVLQEEPKSRGTILSVSEFGQFLLGEQGRDRYLEDQATLWLLHWQLISNQTRCTAWRWAFSALPSNEFTRATLQDALIEVAKRAGDKSPSESSVRRDVEVFVRTYVASRFSSSTVPEESLDCPLVELDLLDESNGLIRFVRGPKNTLPDEVFAFAVADFWRSTASNRQTLSFSDLSYGIGAPGNAFKLDENSLVERLERLETITGGALVYADTAGLKQLYRHADHSPLNYLQKLPRPTATLSLVGV
jgi:Protein of unknown function (DUF4007)